MIDIERSVSKANKQYAWKMLLTELAKLEMKEDLDRKSQHEQDKAKGYSDNWLS